MRKKESNAPGDTETEDDSSNGGHEHLLLHVVHVGRCAIVHLHATARSSRISDESAGAASGEMAGASARVDSDLQRRMGESLPFQHLFGEHRIM